MFACRSAPAHADEPARDPREDEARRECLAGRYQHGIDILATLFTETKDPNHIFNQARCFQQNSRPDDAIARFREYLRKAKDLPAAETAEVQSYIAECEAMKGDHAPPPAPPASGQQQAPPVDTQLREHLEIQEDLRARHFRTAGIVSAAAGVVALGFGGFMGWRTMTLQADFEKTQKDHPGYFDRSAYNDGQRAEVLQWVGYGVGAAAVGTGIVFYYLGYRERESPKDASAKDASVKTVSFIPAIAGRQMGAQVLWRF